MEVDFLSTAEALHVHANQIGLYGGEPGVRDVALLESALAQSRAAFDGKYLHTDLFDMAAAYLYHVVRNHPFLDGNKRTGAMLAMIFLTFNGVSLATDNDGLYEITIGVASGKINKAEVAAYFRALAGQQS